MGKRILNPTYYEFFSLAINWNLSQSRNTKKLGIMKFGSGYWIHELPTQMCQNCKVEIALAQFDHRLYSRKFLTLFGTGGGAFLSPCPCWIRFCQLNFFQKFPNFFEVEIDINPIILTPCPAH